MAEEFCIKLNAVNKSSSPKWIWAIILFVVVLIFLVHKYNKKSEEDDAILKLQKGMNNKNFETKIGNVLNYDSMNNDTIENFRAKTSGVPRHVFHSNWPFPPYPLQKYRFCGNDGYCNPGHQCSDKLFGAMFPPVCTCYAIPPKNLKPQVELDEYY